MAEAKEPPSLADLVDKARGMLADELGNHPDPLLIVVPREQKVLLKSNFDAIAHQLETGNIPPPEQRDQGMAEDVIATWPFTYLGEVIVRAERAWIAYQPSKKNKPSTSSEDSTVSGKVAPDRPDRLPPM